MPESQALTGVVPADIVRSFYAAVQNRDAGQVEALVDEVFAADSYLELPASLPYGGRIEGARRLRRIFAALAAGGIDTGPRALRVDAIVGGEAAAGPDDATVIAVISFDWFTADATEPVPSGACEVWRFRDTQVVGIRAYYWDTAALQATSVTTTQGA